MYTKEELMSDIDIFKEKASGYLGDILEGATKDVKIHTDNKIRLDGGTLLFIGILILVFARKIF